MNKTIFGNQEILSGVLKMPCNKTNLYATINLNAIEHAFEDLTYNEFKVWLYFASKNEKWHESISSVNIGNHVNIKDARSVRKAKASLKEKGYFRVLDDGTYCFMDYPDFHNKINSKCKVKGKDKDEETYSSTIQILTNKLNYNEFKVWTYFANLPSDYETSSIPIENIQKNYPTLTTMDILDAISSLEEKGLVKETEPNTLTFYKYFKEEPTP